MGQYHKIVNLDKQLTITSWDYDCGAKIMEWGYTKCELPRLMKHLMATSWKGDRVIVVGDYANAEHAFDTLGQEAYDKLVEWSRGYESVDNLLSSAYEFQNYKGNPKIKDYRFILNNNTKEFIDIEHCPIEWVYFDEEEDKPVANKIDPLALLLDIGNGQGGGDYHEDKPNYNLVGAWVKDAGNIEISNTHPSGYTEFTEYFTERSEPKTYAEHLEELVARLMHENKRLRGDK